MTISEASSTSSTDHPTKQLLPGPNGSGKSSLVEAIRYLKLFVKGDSNKFTRSTRTRWQDRPLQVIEVEANIDGKPFEYRVEIGFEDVAWEEAYLPVGEF